MFCLCVRCFVRLAVGSHGDPVGVTPKQTTWRAKPLWGKGLGTLGPARYFVTPYVVTTYGVPKVKILPENRAKKAKIMPKKINGQKPLGHNASAGQNATVGVGHNATGGIAVSCL